MAETTLQVFAQIVCVFLALGAVGKLRSPGPAAQGLVVTFGQPRLGSRAVIRALSVLELAAAVVAFLTGSWPSLVLVAFLFVLFAVIVGLGLARGVTDCGCVGAAASPPDRVHLWTNLGAAGFCGAAALHGVPTAAALLAEQPLAGFPYLVAVGCAAGLLVAVVTDRAVVAGRVAALAAERAR